MVKAVLLPYAAVAGFFLRAYLPRRLTVTGVLASLLWPISLALALVWLAALDLDGLRQ